MSGVGFESSGPFSWRSLFGAILILLVLVGQQWPLTNAVTRAVATHEQALTKARITPLPFVPLTFAAVGDSITARAEQGSLYAWQSWTYSADTPETKYVAGGWAEPGRTTNDMLAGTVPLDYADLLVIEGAVNDVNLHYDTTTILANLSAIVIKSTVGRVLIVAVPPNDRYPADALAYNAALGQYAVAQGWDFVDPWTSYRNADGTYVLGAAWDDLHPTEATAIDVGLSIRAAMMDTR